MIRFERTFDYKLVREIVTHPRLWPHITDDFSPKPEEYWPLTSDALWYVLVMEEMEVLGLFAFHQENGVCWKVHTCLLPVAWGRRGTECAQKVIQWLWENTPCRRLITDVPEDNRLALAFAIRAGMNIYGVNEKSILRGGKLMDQTVLGISKPEEACHS